MTEPRTRYEWTEGRKMAAELTKRHPEILKDVPPLSDILFVMDEAATPKSKGNFVLARVSKIPTKFEEFVFEGTKTWMLEWFKASNEHMTMNQRLVLMVHELLHFEYDDEKGIHKLRGHDFEDFRLLVDRFGYRWNQIMFGDVPDILSQNFTWGKEGQSQLKIDGEADEQAAEVATTTPQDDTPPADDWQPEKPYATPNNVVPLRSAQAVLPGTGAD